MARPRRITAVPALQWIENELDKELSDEDLDLDQESDEEYDDSRSSESETEGVRTSNPQLDLDLDIDPNVPGCSNRPQTSAQPSKKRRIDLDISVANAGRSRNEQESEWEEIGAELDLPVETWTRRSCFTIFWGNNQVVYARNHGTVAHKLLMIET